MSRPSKLNSYSDVAAVLAEALKRNGGRFRLTSAKSAIRWRQRANLYRRLLVEIEGVSPYDHFIFTIAPADPAAVLIEPRSIKGTLETLDGEVVDIEAVDPNLDAQAQKLKEELGLADADPGELE